MRRFHTNGQFLSLCKLIFLLDPAPSFPAYSFYGFESIFKRLFVLFGKPRVGPIKRNRTHPILYICLSLYSCCLCLVDDLNRESELKASGLSDWPH